MEDPRCAFLLFCELQALRIKCGLVRQPIKSDEPAMAPLKAKPATRRYFLGAWRKVKPFMKPAKPRRRHRRVYQDEVE